MIGDEIIRSGLVEPYDFIDVSYAKYRLKEIEKGYIRKQIKGGIAPTIKTQITNYGVVVYDR